MKITNKIISIPPHISTSWDKIAALHTENELIIFTLNNQVQIALSGLDQGIIQTLFAAHAAYLQETTLPTQAVKGIPTKFEEVLSGPLKIMFGAMESAAQVLQHDPAHSDLPPIPPEIADKISALAKSISPDAVMAMPSAEPGCNCMYCQMARIIKGEAKVEEEQPPHSEKAEEAISDDELRFEEWAVSSVGDKMYLVTNKLDPEEHYTVFLGDPIGCTCGKPHCDHIIAVLRH